jgi:hypothetical protein
MADDFNALKTVLREQSIRKRHHNRESSPQVLERHGVGYESRNGGIHLIVNCGGMVVDFWPGTGKWIARNAAKSSGRGVFKLIEWLGVKG